MDADFYLGVGEAALVLRADGTIEVKAFDGSASNRNILTCIGLSLALDNSEWRRRLEDRTEEKYGSVLDKIVFAIGDGHETNK